jgi:hypothetical protein
MGKVEGYIARLRVLADWDDFLLVNSNLPGPRGNLELVYAAAEAGDEARLVGYVGWAARPFDTNDPAVIPLMAGVVGLGRLAADGSDAHWNTLRALASDARWRVREAVAMALQRAGLARYDALIEHTRPWRTGSPLERRALAAGLCEPALLRDPDHARIGLGVLDELTASLVTAPERRDDGARVLRQALGYCWSVAIAALPHEGWPAFERWAASDDADVRWVMRENLGKNRLRRLDPDRVAALRERLGG